MRYLRLAGMETVPGRLEELQQFFNYAMSQQDVWFVTNQQVGWAAVGPSQGQPALPSTRRQPRVAGQCGWLTVTRSQPHSHTHSCCGSS